MFFYYLIKKSFVLLHLLADKKKPRSSNMPSLIMPCFCPNLTCFACYVRAVFRAIILIPNPDEQSITDYIMVKISPYSTEYVNTILELIKSIFKSRYLKELTEKKSDKLSYECKTANHKNRN
ncbi:hypothetical protein QTP88_017881 [Uroleucon formosanum]